MSETKFTLLEAQSLEKLFQKIDTIENHLQRLHYEKELPEELTINEAAATLRLSKQRLYNLIYTHELKAIQHKKNGKVRVSREEILRFKKQNIKAIE
jgi:excisionase family DNA binding protein